MGFFTAISSGVFQFKLFFAAKERYRPEAQITVARQDSLANAIILNGFNSAARIRRRSFGTLLAHKAKVRELGRLNDQTSESAAAPAFTG
jgi:hypothetical protein